jgi:hypothetical protein
MRRAVPLVLLCLTQCAQRTLYIGTIQPVSGTCDPASQATLNIRDQAVEFAPTAGVLILSGKIAADGFINATLIRPGADKNPYRLSLRAALANRQVNGEYVSQRCRYTVHLTRD